MVYLILGIVAAVVFIVADSIYLYDTIKGNNKPQRTAWGIGFIMSVIAFANQIASGADDSLWVYGAAVVLVGAIFLASFKNKGSRLKRHDYIVLAVAAVGLVLWYLFDDPVFSVIATAGIFTGSMSLNFAKAKRDPESETRITWLLASLSGLINTFAVGELEFRLLLLPIMSFALQGYMSYLLYVQPRRTGAS